ncbi:MAG: antitoxin VapB family protein [Thermoanaerobaculia bacterium]
MSTKTIAVDTRVYDRLAAEKRDGESFSKTIDRLLAEAAGAHTGRDVLNRLAELPALSAVDAESFLSVVAEDRESEEWEPVDLR